jgi:hypothetical protein
LNGLPQTGQTTVYAVGDDGTNQTGVPHRYEVLTTGQYSGTTNITINSKTDAHSNAVVIDHQFKLMYSQTASASVGTESNGKIPWTTTGSGSTAEGVFPYVNAANLASLSGYTDWRLPSVHELTNILDFEVTTASPSAAYFPGIPTTAWASTTRKSLTTQAAFRIYTSGMQLKTTADYVLLVRSM